VRLPCMGFETGDVLAMNNKVFDIKELKNELLKYKNGKIVFTNGCFDVLHIGHVRLLQFAKQQGDCLVIAINSDESVRRLKGAKRPIVPQNDRAEVLSALACVDYIVIFDEDTPVETISALKPDIHVKGGDYDMEKIPEAKIISSYGGEMRRFEFVEGRSSSNIVERILKAYG